MEDNTPESYSILNDDQLNYLAQFIRTTAILESKYSPEWDHDPKTNPAWNFYTIKAELTKASLSSAMDLLEAIRSHFPFFTSNPLMDIIMSLLEDLADQTSS